VVGPLQLDVLKARLDAEYAFDLTASANVLSCGMSDTALDQLQNFGKIRLISNDWPY
jgi:peptide subunit release factor RF-3